MMADKNRHWSERFIGLAYADLGRTPEGVDCWGLVRLVLASQGIDVPCYSGGYASTQERAEIAGLIEGAKPSWIRSLVPQELDLVTFRRGRLESHVGIVVEPGRMLHVTSGMPSCIESYRDEYWSARLTGFWRHAGSRSGS